MSRTFGQKFLIELERQPADVDHVGVKLARLCVQANLPAKYVAAALDVSPVTVYAWFRGNKIRQQRDADKIAAMLEYIQTGFEVNILPANKNRRAKEFIYKFPLAPPGLIEKLPRVEPKPKMVLTNRLPPKEVLQQQESDALKQEILDLYT